MPANFKPAFTEMFKGFEDYYVLIGGTATSIVLDAQGIGSRTTKDYDMVLVDDFKNRDFYDILIRFIEEGEYSATNTGDRSQLFRFVTSKEGYPEMLELFSIRPDYPLNGKGRGVPVHFDDDASLSALLLDQDYYELLLRGKEVVDGYSVLNNKGLIVFKSKAWLDMKEKVERGEEVQSRKIKKHLNDISRLIGSLSPNDRLNELHPAVNIIEDMQRFLNYLEKNIQEIPQNKDIVFSREEIYEFLKNFIE